MSAHELTDDGLACACGWRPAPTAKRRAASLHAHLTRERRREQAAR